MTPDASRATHVRSLDGLRAVAALAVVGTHVGFWTGLVSPSFIGALVGRLDSGVALFFALSGYLLARPWIAAALDENRQAPSLRTYSIRRLARIAPAYWCVLAFVLLLEIGNVFRPELRSDAVSPGTIATHLVVMQGMSEDYYSSFSQTWSLTTEVTFYVALPFLGMLALRRAARRSGAERLRAVSRICAGGVVLGAATSAFAVSSLPLAGGGLSTSLLGHAGWFAAGAWVCAIRLAGRVPRRLARLGPDELVGLAALCLVVAASPVGGNLLFTSPQPWQAAIRELLYGALAALALLAATHPSGGASVTSRVLTSRALSWVGDRSYGLFLWHLPILFVVLTVLGGGLFERSPLLVGALTLGISLTVADASFRWIEGPIMRWAHRRTQLTRQ